LQRFGSTVYVACVKVKHARQVNAWKQTTC